MNATPDFFSQHLDDIDDTGDIAHIEIMTRHEMAEAIVWCRNIERMINGGAA